MVWKIEECINDDCDVVCYCGCCSNSDLIGNIDFRFDGVEEDGYLNVTNAISCRQSDPFIKITLHLNYHEKKDKDKI